MAVVDERWAEKEERVLSLVRQHLREARRNAAVGELVFRFQMKNGGIRQSSIGLKVEYEFVSGESAL